MANPKNTARPILKQRWLKIVTTLVIAIIFAAVVLLIPVTTSSEITISLPVQDDAIQINLPTGVEIAKAQTDLKASKHVFPSTEVNQGELITYTILLTNNTGFALTDIRLTDTLPVNISCIGTSIDSSNSDWLKSSIAKCENDGEVRWLLDMDDGTMADGSTVVFSFTARVDEPFIDQTIISNNDYRAEAESPSPFIASPTNSADVIVNAPNWNISKFATPFPNVEPGDLLTYTILIKNDGHLITEGAFTVTDELPAFTNFITASNGGIYDNGAGDITWNLTETLDIDEVFTVTYAVTVTLPLPDGTSIVNQTYAVTGGNVFSQAFGSDVIVTVNTPVTLTVSKLDNPDPVAAGELLNYTIIVTNSSASKGPADNVVVTDTFPANTQLIGVGLESGIDGIISVVTDSHIVTWQITDSIPIGAMREMTLTLRVDSPLTNSTILNNDYEASVSNSLNFLIYDPPAVTTTVVSTPTLHVTKAANPTNIEAGDVLTYTIVYSNSGNANAIGVIITDTLDDNAVFSETFGTPAGVHDGSSSGGDIVWDIGFVEGEAAQIGILTVTVQITKPLPDDSLITNTVSIASLQGMTATETITTPVNSRPDLQISKQVEPSPTVAAGELLTYTLTISNIGNALANNAILTDVMPANTTFYSATVGFTPANPTAGNPITWLIPTISLDETLTYTLIVTVNNPLANGTQITNTANIRSTFDQATSETVTTTVESTATLEIFKVGVPASVEAGGLIMYTIRYTNTGNANANGVVITDIYPSQGSFVGEMSEPDISPGTSILGDTGRVWTIPGGLSGNNGSGIITLTLRTDTPLDSGTIIDNVVEISADEPTRSIYTASNTIVSAPILTITKSVSPSPAPAGSTLNYTIIYTNSGNMNATGVVITDTYEGVGTLVDPSLPTVTVTADQVVWQIGQVTADGSPRILTLDVELPESVADNAVVTNTIEIVSLQDVDSTDTITTALRGREADLEIRKTRVGSGDVIAGELITYTLTITNIGPDTVDATVTDTFDTNEATFVSCDPAICTGTTPPIVWNLDNFTNTQVLTLVLDTQSDFLGTFVNRAGITTTSINDLDPIMGNNSDDESALVRNPTAELQITKIRGGTDDIIAGDLINYTIIITNAGPDAVDVVITDTFDLSQAIFNTCAPSGCTNPAAPDDNKVQWNVDQFEGVVLLNLILQARTDFSGTLVNNVEITSTLENFLVDPVQFNNSDDIDVPVRFPTSDFGVDKEQVGTTPIVAGDLVTYTITISNDGPDESAAIVTDTFDISKIASVVSCDGCTDLGTGTLVWNLASFSTTQTRTVVLRTANTFAGTLTNTVEIAHAIVNAVDLNESNNEDNVDVTVRLPEANLSISKAREGSTDVVAGDFITYTITITNVSGDVIDNLLVTDNFIPASGAAEISSCDNGCVIASNTASWNITSLSIGVPQTLQLVLETSPSFTGTIVNTADITFTIPAVELDASDNESSVSTAVRYPTADLQIFKSTAATETIAGESIDYSITVFNPGPDPADVTITDSFITSVAGFNSCSDSCTGTGPIIWNLNQLIGGKTLTLTLDTSSTFSGTFVNNVQIDFTGTGTEDNAGNENDSVSVPVIMITRYIYLPILLKDFSTGPTPTPTPTPDPAEPTPTFTPTPDSTPRPDLIITSFTVNPSNASSTDQLVVRVVVKNDGPAATGEGFWTDFYVNPQVLPNTTSLGADRRWKISPINSTQGIGWAIPPLAAGESVVLTSDGSEGIGPTIDPDKDITDWDGLLPIGDYTFYAFVDSFDGNDSTGATNVEVIESNENNNMSSAVSLNIITGAKAAEEAEKIDGAVGPRPDLGSN